jgi:hypothetical protein
MLVFKLLYFRMLKKPDEIFLGHGIFYYKKRWQKVEFRWVARRGI